MAERSLLLSVAVLGVTCVCGCEAAPQTAESFTTTTFGYTCVVDRVVVDPDDRVSAVEPGCAIELEVQAFGPGGSFDVGTEDDAGGRGTARDYPIDVSDGDRFIVDHFLEDVLPPEVEVTVYMDPHSPDYVCTGETRGRAGTKLFPRADVLRDCVVTFRVTDEVDLGALRFRVDYAASGANFPGCGTAVFCEPLIGKRGPLNNYPSDNDDKQELTIRVASGLGFSTPADVYHCDLDMSPGADQPSSDTFIITVESGRTPPPLSRPLTELPSVEARVDCELGPTTTTTLGFVPATCGQPCSPESMEPKARDALFVLEAAIGSVACKTCICDVNRSGQIDATDALTVISRAVGLDAFIRCVECASAVPRGCEQR